MVYHTIEEFINDWNNEAILTQNLLDVLTDESLKQQVIEENRTLGRLAWHIVTSLHEMMSRTGLTFEGVEHDHPVPVSAKEIADSYRITSDNMLKAIREQWTDDSLQELDDMYGEKWPKAVTLTVIIKHQIHHRGQMTVLMRQAGLMVPGVYGPSREEWEAIGMTAPEI